MSKSPGEPSRLERMQSILYLQQFIAHPGWDLRAFVLGGRSLDRHASLCQERLANTNVAQGGRAEPIAPTARKNASPWKRPLPWAPRSRASICCPGPAAVILCWK